MSEINSSKRRRLLTSVALDGDLSKGFDATGHSNSYDLASFLSVPLFRSSISNKQDQRPKNHVSPDEVDQLLASDLKNLTVRERERVYDDIHGTSQPTKEDDVFIEERLQSLQEEVDSIQTKKAYDQAKARNPDYVNDRKFCRMFLRAKDYDVREAADQIVNFFDVKLSLFGPELLVETIQWEHLTRKEKYAYLDGGIQRLPHQDRSGRAIVFVSQRLLATYDLLTTSRLIFYSTMSYLEDDNAQRNGTVVVAWMHGASSHFHVRHMKQWDVGKALPSRMVGMHFCGPSIHPTFHLFLRLCTSAFRTRFKLNLGSPMECIYRLASYGITKDVLPVDEFDNIVLKAHLSPIQQRDKLERMIAGFEPMYELLTTNNVERTSDINVPGPFDVLLGGNTKDYYENPGNVVFRRLLALHEQEYNTAPFRAKKKKVCEHLLSEVHQGGGKFLIRGKDGHFEEMEDKSVIERVKQAFRNRRNRQVD